MFLYDARVNIQKKYENGYNYFVLNYRFLLRPIDLENALNFVKKVYVL